MLDEYNTLIEHNTYDLMRQPHNVNAGTGKQLYVCKFRSNGKLECYKAYWVDRGFTQKLGINCDGIFSPVVKPAATIQNVLS